MLDSKTLPQNVYKEIEDVLGVEYISQLPAVLDSYAWQPAINLAKFPWIFRPAAVVLPQTTEEVQQIVKICNKHGVKYKAHSTGWANWSGPGRFPA